MTKCPLRLKFFFRPRAVKKDVIVTTFIKSGTHMEIQTAMEIAWKGGAPEKCHIHDIVAWPDFPDQSIIVSLAKAPVAPQTDLRVIKTHALSQPYRTDTLYVIVLRDPKEIAVSTYYFIFGALGVRRYVTLEAWMDACFPSLLYLWTYHVAYYWPWRNRSNVLLRTYQQILADRKSAAKNLANFMQVTLTDQEMERVLEKSSFAYMKRHKGRFAPPICPITNMEEYPDMIRRGKAGRSDELLSAAQQKEIDDYCRETLRGMGSDFPYDEIFCQGAPVG